MKNKVVAIVQARVGSSRLFGKVLLSLCGKTVLQHDIERIRQSQYIDEVIIATTVESQDQMIVDEAIRNNCKYYRGSEDNVLSRYYEAAKMSDADVVVRVTSDCPLIDPKVIDDIIAYYIKNKYDLVTNAGKDEVRTYPRGLDCEVFSMEQLEKAYLNASETYQLEHVTPYIYEYGDVYYYENIEDYSGYRWTLDTPEDYLLIGEIYRTLYKGQHDFYMEDVLNLYKDREDLFSINQHIKQKKMTEIG